MISDVLPGSPAEDAGLRPRDIITAVDGASVSALPYYAAMMYLHDPDRAGCGNGLARRPDRSSFRCRQFPSTITIMALLPLTRTRALFPNWAYSEKP